MRDTIGELRLQTYAAVSFWYDILCVLTHITRKLGVVYERSVYQTTALLSEMSIIWVKTAHKLRFAGCGSKPASQSLSDTPFARTYTHNLKTIVAYMDVLHIERPLYYRGYFLYGLELRKRSDWKATAPDTHGGRSLIFCCCCCDCCLTVVLPCLTVVLPCLTIAWLPDCINHYAWLLPL